MASKSDKENTVHRNSRSRVPVRVKNSSELTKYRPDKMIGIIDRRPLGEIQTTTDGGMTNVDTKMPKKNAAKKDTSTITTKVSPKGSVLVKTKSQKSEAKPPKEYNNTYLALDLKHVTPSTSKQRNSPLDWKRQQALKDFNQNMYMQRHVIPKTNLETRSKSADRSSTIPKSIFQVSTFAQNNMQTNYLRKKKLMERNMTALPEKFQCTHSKKAERPPHIQITKPVSKKPKTMPDSQHNPSNYYLRTKDRSENITTQMKMLSTKRRSKSAERPSMIPKPGFYVDLTSTPTSGGQNNGVKNIKRSLKRPSSRELRRRSSSEADIQTDPTLQRDVSLPVECSITLDSLNLSSPQRIRELTLTYEQCFIDYLLLRCQGLRNPPLYCPKQRSFVVDWMVRINGYQALSMASRSSSPRVLQVAVRHLDQVLTTEETPIVTIQRLAAACFWLAEKQCAKPRSATIIAKSSAYAFSEADLRTTERYVLRTLNWPPIPVVAEDFMPHLVQLCSPTNPEPLQTAATFFCTAAMLDADLSACPADLLAVAAVINSALLLKDSGDIKCLRLCPIYRSAIRSGRLRLREVRSQLQRTVLVMGDESCPCREPYAQLARAPHLIAPRLAGKASMFPEPLEKEEFIRAQMYNHHYSPALPAVYSWPQQKHNTTPEYTAVRM